MNSKTKRRAIIVTGIIIVVMVLTLAFIGGSQSAKTITLKEALTGGTDQGKIQVSGNVVPNSYSVDQNGVLTFTLYDPENESAGSLSVSYDKGVAATFGNDVVAICTGEIDKNGILQCSELITKCPSKYENATDALSVSAVLNYGSDIVGTTIKVQGSVAPGTLVPAGSDQRFALADGAKNIPVVYNGALPDDITDNTEVVVTGALDKDGKFLATDVAVAKK